MFPGGPDPRDPLTRIRFFETPHDDAALLYSNRWARRHNIQGMDINEFKRIPWAMGIGCHLIVELRLSLITASNEL